MTLQFGNSLQVVTPHEAPVIWAAGTCRSSLDGAAVLAPLGHAPNLIPQAHWRLCIARDSCATIAQALPTLQYIPGRSMERPASN